MTCAWGDKRTVGSSALYYRLYWKIIALSSDSLVYVSFVWFSISIVVLVCPSLVLSFSRFVSPFFHWNSKVSPLSNKEQWSNMYCIFCILFYKSCYLVFPHVPSNFAYCVLMYILCLYICAHDVMRYVCALSLSPYLWVLFFSCSFLSYFAFIFVIPNELCCQIWFWNEKRTMQTNDNKNDEYDNYWFCPCQCVIG